MNQRNLRRFELRLGPLQLTILIGIILGSLTGAYFLGTWTGQQAGFAIASEKILTSAPREDIGLQAMDRTADGSSEPVADIYAKLSDAGSKTQAVNGGKREIPKLGVIEEGTVENTEHIDAKVPTAEGEEASLAAAKKLDESTAAAKSHEIPKSEKEAVPTTDLQALREEGSARILGRDDAKSHDHPNADSKLEAKLEDRKTLGALLKEEEAKVKKTKHLGNPNSSSPVITVSKDGVTTVKKPDATFQKPAVPTIVPTVIPTVVPTPPVVRPVDSPRTVPAPKTSIMVETALKKGWFAQVAAPKSSEEANSLSRALKSSGFLVSIEKAEVRGEHYYRLLVGPEENKAQAERLVEQLKRGPNVKGAPFLRLVK